MSPRALFLGPDRRVSITLGAAILGIGTILGGAGATFTFKANSEAKDGEHDRSLADHETRLRAIERDTADRLARIESKIDDLRRRAP